MLEDLFNFWLVKELVSIAKGLTQVTGKQIGNKAKVLFVLEAVGAFEDILMIQPVHYRFLVVRRLERPKVDLLFPEHFDGNICLLFLIKCTFDVSLSANPDLTRDGKSFVEELLGWVIREQISDLVGDVCVLVRKRSVSSYCGIITRRSQLH